MGLWCSLQGSRIFFTSQLQSMLITFWHHDAHNPSSSPSTGLSWISYGGPSCSGTRILDGPQVHYRDMVLWNSLLGIEAVSLPAWFPTIVTIELPWTVGLNLGGHRTGRGHSGFKPRGCCKERPFENLSAHSHIRRDFFRQRSLAGRVFTTFKAADHLPSQATARDDIAHLPGSPQRVPPVLNLQFGGGLAIPCTMWRCQQILRLFTSSYAWADCLIVNGRKGQSAGCGPLRIEIWRAMA